MRVRVRYSVGTLALWALAAFIFTFPSQSGVAIAGVGSLSRLVGIAAFGVGLLALFDGNRFRLRTPSLFLILTALFVVWSAVTFFWAISPTATLARLNTYGQLAVMAWLIHQFVRSDRDLDFVWQTFVLGCYLMIGSGAAAFIGSEGAVFRDVGRMNANGFAIISALAIPMAWGLTLRRKHRWLQIVNAAYPFFALFAIVLAASRGGLLTALVALLIVPLTVARLGLLARFVLFVAIAAFLWAGVALVQNRFPELQQNLDRLAETEEQLAGGTLTGRTVIWSAGLDVFRTSPMIGVGAGGFETAVHPILGAPRAPHNAFMSVAVGSGLIGLVLYVLVLLAVLVGLLANRERRVEHLVLFAALMVALMPTNSDNDKFAWFILAAFAAARPVLVVAGARRRPSRGPGGEAVRSVPHEAVP